MAELIGSTRDVVTGMMIEFRQRGLPARLASTACQHGLPAWLASTACQHGLIDYKRGDISPNIRRLTSFLNLETTSVV